MVAQPTVLIHLAGDSQAPDECSQFVHSDEIDVYEAAGQMRQQLIDHIASHDDFAAARAAWVECMSAGGFDYASADEAFDDLTGRWNRLDLEDSDAVDDFRKAELRVADADSQCTRQHVLPVTSVLEAAFLRERGVTLPVPPSELGQ